MNFVPRFGRNIKSGLFNFTRNPARKYTTPSTTSTSSIPPIEPPNPNATYPLTKTKKFLCVWAKRFPTMNEVPDHVTPALWSKVRSIIRIKVANYTMLMIIVGCVVMVVTGKRARDRGETIMQRNLDWHQKYDEGNSEEIHNIGLFGK
ncbi:Protein of unknown function DUF1075 [Cinara cedri]|uniref:Uncharacterized protein n=1 Tax=Cinara cedri TaxID=506608 RepID=A0A5E4MDR7_9HEMI|nr:Protein of unknown function DUF1075 [Cinara cedri]